MAALALGACGIDDSGDITVVHPGEWQPPVDPTEAAYDPDHILRIDIEMEAAEWDALRLQTRSIFDVVGSSCLAEPPPRPFTYFPAAVTIDGERFEDVGVRKKGFFGSLSETKPSLKVDFDQYVGDQRFSGLKQLTLNNATSDAAYVKQCLGYAVFAAAGVPAPRCSFATVSVNGASLGIYVNVEGIKKQFLARHFDDDDGNLYEGALSDFRPGWVDTFQKKTNESDPDRSDLDPLVAAMELPDADVLGALEALIDLDGFIDLWAAELLLMHADGYARNTNNFYLYRDPTSGLFSFIPWGIDSIMFEDTTLPWEDARPPVAVWAEGALARRLYELPETRAKYFGRIQTLLDSVWNEAALQDEIDRMEALLSPELPSAERAGFQAALAAVRAFVSDRRDVLETALGEPAPTWEGPLRDPWCIDIIGELDATFSTTWGTLGADDPFALGSTAAIDLTLGGTLQPSLATAATAGLDADSGLPAVQLVLATSATEVYVAHLTVQAESFAPGATTPLDLTLASGYLIRIIFQAGTEPAFEVVGIVAEGTIALDQAATTAGAPVSGRVTSMVYEPLF